MLEKQIAIINGEIPVIPVESKGSIFKKSRGYSKSTLRLFHKYGINRNNTKEALEILREFRKVRRKKAKVVKKNKHFASKEWMRTKGKVRKSKHKGRTKGKGGAKSAAKIQIAA